MVLYLLFHLTYQDLVKVPGRVLLRLLSASPLCFGTIKKKQKEAYG